MRNNGNHSHDRTHRYSCPQAIQEWYVCVENYEQKFTAKPSKPNDKDGALELVKNLMFSPKAKNTLLIVMADLEGRRTFHGVLAKSWVAAPQESWHLFYGESWIRPYSVSSPIFTLNSNANLIFVALALKLGEKGWLFSSREAVAEKRKRQISEFCEELMNLPR